MGQPPLDTRHPDQGMKQSPPPLPDRDELRSFAELLRETEVLARRYATKHGVAALKRIVDELPPFTDLSRNYQEAAAVAKLEEESKVSGVGADEGEGSSEPGRHRRPFPLYRPSPGGGMAAMAQEGVREEQEMRMDSVEQNDPVYSQESQALRVEPLTDEQISDYLKSCVEDGTLESIPCPPAPPPEESEEAGLDPRIEELDRRAALILPKPGSRWIWQPDKPYATVELEIEAVRWNGEEFWVTTRGSRSVIDETHNNDLDHFLESAVPCPAPPPSVSAAEETSSGEERSTAGGACEPRRRFLEVFGNLRHAGEGVEGIGPFTHCPWCGTKLDKET